MDWLASAATDGVGRITVEEFTADGLRQFAMLDPDRNGRLTLAELPPTPLQQMMKRERPA